MITLKRAVILFGIIVTLTIDYVNGRLYEYSNDDSVDKNIFFLLDASGSITSAEFAKMKEFVKLFIRQVGISPNVGVIKASVSYFTHDSTISVPLTVSSVEEAIRLIDAIEKKKEGGTNIARALRDLIKQVIAIKRNPETRYNKNIAFIMTDGTQTQGGRAKTESRLLRELLNVKMFAVVVGKNNNQETLKIITNDETKIFDFDLHKKLYEIISAAVGIQTGFNMCGIDRIIFPEDNNGRYGLSKRIKRVVGGQVAKYSWPWMAALYRKLYDRWSFTCGGSIIHKNWILSAAHCFVHVDSRNNSIDIPVTTELQNPNMWKVSVGRLDLSDERSGLDYFVSEIKVHQNYVAENYGNDIALLKLKYPIAYDIYTRSICLPPPLYEFPRNSTLYASGKDAFVIGWGHTEERGLNSTAPVRHSVNLNELKLPLQDDKICKKTVTYTKCIHNKCRTISIAPSPNSLCTGTGKGGEDSCHADGGGPLMQFVSSNSSGIVMNRWFEIGLVSWGPGGCGVKGYYGYYTHVSKLRQWILNETNAEFEDVTLTL